MLYDQLCFYRRIFDLDSALSSDLISQSMRGMTIYLIPIIFPTISDLDALKERPGYTEMSAIYKHCLQFVELRLKAHCDYNKVDLTKTFNLFRTAVDGA